MTLGATRRRCRSVALPTPTVTLGIELFWRGLDLLLHCLHVEACTFLHRREFDEGLGIFADLLLDVDEPPELVHEEIIIRERASCRSRHSEPLEWVEPEIGNDRPINFHRAAEPTAGLIDETVFIVVDSNRAERAFGEIEDLVPVGWAFSGQQACLVVAVEMNLVVAIAELLALLQLGYDVRIAGDRGKRR